MAIRPQKKNKSKKWVRRGKKADGESEGDAAPSTYDPARLRVTADMRTNAAFEAYYQRQGIVPEGEWDDFMAALRRSLPTTFRITGTRAVATELRDRIKREYVPYFERGITASSAAAANDGGNAEKVIAGLEDTPFTPPAPIPWYPDGMGWKFDVPRAVLRKAEGLNRFHKFLVTETEVGNTCRQEEVSMIPPMLLDVEPHHAVLDMCAAPGSKTAQLLEALHKMEDSSPRDIPTGIVIANDFDLKRACMLVHQTKRLHSPCLLITNHEAQGFPNVYIQPPQRSGSTVHSKGDELKFDRILADVPCSGDGTLRKNPAIWINWKPMDGMSLHPLQIKILRRGLQLLKPGGRLVYSTCSLNPMENESVVAAILNEFAASSGAHAHDVKLVDVSERFPNLRRHPGLTDWKVVIPDAEMTELASAETPLPEGTSRGIRNKVWKTMFVPSNVAELGLEKCLRIYPHHQDCGGFFVAVLEKSAEPKNVKKPDSEPASPEAISAEESAALAATKRPQSDVASPPPVDADGEDTSHKRARLENDDDEAPAVEDADVDGDVDGDAGTTADDGKKKKTDPTPPAMKDEPFTFLPGTDAQVSQIVDFYGLDAEFPRDCFLVRAAAGTEKHNTLHYTSRTVKALLTHTNPARLRPVQSGVKLFGRMDGGGEAACPFRLFFDGVPLVAAHMKPEQYLSSDFASLKRLLVDKMVKIPLLSEPLQSRVASLPIGGYVLEYDASKQESDAADVHVSALNVSSEPLLVPVFRTRGALNLLVGGKDLRSLCLRILGEDESTHTTTATTTIATSDAPAATTSEDALPASESA
ncbi:S-adenosyl-L-methionine-dependent methyltransferase [Ramicandelaber brevisporus]|nr:S-adenosyl-L-methionine-dependent methyltransferase [Ramicandelaber brevisporus]